MALGELPLDMQTAVGLRVPASEQGALATRIAQLYSAPPQVKPLSDRAIDASDALAGGVAGMTAGGGTLAVETGLSAVLLQQILSLPDTPLDPSFPLTSPKVIGLGLITVGFGLGFRPAVELAIDAGKGIASAVADTGIGAAITRGVDSMIKPRIDAQRHQDGIRDWLRSEGIMPQSAI